MNPVPAITFIRKFHDALLAVLLALVFALAILPETSAAQEGSESIETLHEHGKRWIEIDGTLYFQVGPNSDPLPVESEVSQSLRAQAEQGDVEAQFNLGQMYLDGSEIRRNEHEAVKWIRLAAEQGHADAQFSLFLRGAYDRDIDKMKWLRLAAEQGHAAAQTHLGIHYGGIFLIDGQDYKEAAKWFRRAAKQGNAEAQNELGHMYRTGKGVNKNYSEAIKWFRLAAEQGSSNAQFYLGVMYDNGEGVPQNYWEAYIWYSLAATREYGISVEKAAENRDDTARKLSPADLSSAQEEAARRHAEIQSETDN